MYFNFNVGNPFNDKNFQYDEIYQKLINFNNALDIKDETVLRAYE